MKIVYQAYGRQDILEQVYFSLVSLLARRQPTATWSVLIYTDQPEYFAEFQATDLVELRIVTNEEIVDWSGPLNFVHRVKLCILRDAATRTKDSILYLDGDTVFLQDPECLKPQITDQHSVMHVREYSFEKPNNPLARKLRKFLKGKFWHLELDGKKFDFAIDYRFFMWNAGVIGLSSGRRELLGQMISLSDQLHAAYPKHVMEQLAVSVVLQKTTQISPSDHVVLHYWNQKPEFQKLIADFRGTNSGLQAARSAFAGLAMPIPPPPKKTFFQKIFG